MAQHSACLSAAAAARTPAPSATVPAPLSTPTATPSPASASAAPTARAGGAWCTRTCVSPESSSPTVQRQSLQTCNGSHCSACREPYRRDENVQTFLDAIEQVFGADMDLQSECSALESVSSEPKTCRASDESMSSVHTSDSDVTKSTKKVVEWKKRTKDNTPSPLPPGVLWRKSAFEPGSLHKHGLSVIEEHVIEDHIKAFETALCEHEVELVNEMRVMKGEPPISEKSCVIVNNCVYVTGGPAIFACVMETYDDEKSVNIFIHVNTATFSFVVECSKTGACLKRCPVASMRFWKELGTATLCMLPADGSRRHMAPTTYFHLESVSHCRLFAKELSRK